MIAIIDSGSTKSDWVLLKEGGGQESYETMGLNPYHHSAEIITRTVSENEGLLQHAPEIRNVYFYGAGCSSGAMRKIVESGLAPVFKNAKIKVDHDLVACAYATYGGGPSISCILGTGSNSCHFDGEKVTELLPSIGYFFGDEAGGSYFGKHLLKDYLYKRLPAEFEKDLESEYALSKDSILERVYMKKSPNSFLASFMPFITVRREHPYFQKMLHQGFAEFIQIHVHCFADHAEVPVHFIGSVAFYCQDELRIAAEATGIHLGQIIQKPIKGLVKYHTEMLNRSSD